MVDTKGYSLIDKSASKSRSAAAVGNWTEATRSWESTEGDILAATKHADFYNILKPVEVKSEEPRESPNSTKGLV